MPFQLDPTDEKCVNTIRTLAVDTVSKANSGHPGAPLGMAPITHILFSRFFNANPKNSAWPNRDRFVLSNGHACALQYSLLHMLGYKVSIDDLKGFRQLDSITPGHPEVGVTDGIEVTTGPLGQGFANAVGLAIAQAHLGATFNKDGFKLFDNYTYMFTGDGCLMEGVASEAASLAGHLKLENLIAVYDDNHISIDGDTACAFTEDVQKRFQSYGWNVLTVEKGDTDHNAMYDALEKARANKGSPTIIALRTTIGFGSRDAGTGHVHGSPLKADDVKQLKEKFGFDPEQFFFVPDEVKKAYGAIGERGAKLDSEWESLLGKYAEKFPKEHAELTRRIKGEFPEGWEKTLPVYTPKDSAVASRKLSEIVLTKLYPTIPELVSGSADLTGSNLTRWQEKAAIDFQPESTGLGTYEGRYIRYGVREHAMGAIMNGLAAYGKNLVVPLGGTFLNFVSYAAGAVRLSALSHLRVIWVATHDSIGLGEDGPTHQPVETVAHLRAIPNLMVWRPADGNETSAAYLVALKSSHTPSVIALSRQNLPHLAGSSIEKAAKGGYIVYEPSKADGKLPDVTLVSTGSEVSIVIEAADLLQKDGLSVRVVSLPCFEVFDTLPKAERLEVFPDGVPVISVEPYSTVGWAKYSHDQIGINTFGASGPYKEVYKKYGIVPDVIASKAKKAVEFYKGRPLLSPLNKAFDES